MEYRNAQIDHIIPKTVRHARLQELKVRFGLADDFDPHDPQNLAPICVRCNPRKSDTDYEAPFLKTVLDCADNRRAAVISRVLSFGASGKVAERLLIARAAGLSDQAIREEFEEHAPLLARILSLVDYQSFVLVDVALNQSERCQAVDVSLDRRGRATKALVEEVCGSDLGSLLGQPIAQLIEDLDESIQSDFEYMDSDAPVRAGDGREYLTINVDTVDFERTDKSIRFLLRGSFSAGMPTSLLLSNPKDGAEQLQEGATLSGLVQCDVHWTFAGFEASECLLEELVLDNCSSQIHLN
ncbi:HNH endonuclease [Streptacidiphilus sp. 4-A2]|nr:HNH endonuclease [Streptacidiphilus sp. 4-A2]